MGLHVRLRPRDAGGVGDMRVRVKFEINPNDSDDLAPSNFAGATDMDELEGMVLTHFEEFDPAWSLSINKDDLKALWEQVQKLQVVGL
jgi:hypothetical protein